MSYFSCRDHIANSALRKQSFWIYCRMIILASLCAGKPVALEPKDSINGCLSPDPTIWTLEFWLKKVVFLHGMIQDFWSRTPDNMDAHALQLRTT